MNPTRFKIVDMEPPFYVGEFFWMLNETEARRIVPIDDFGSDNILCSVENTKTDKPLCVSQNSVFNVQIGTVSCCGDRFRVVSIHKSESIETRAAWEVRKNT